MKRREKLGSAEVEGWKVEGCPGPSDISESLDSRLDQGQQWNSGTDRHNGLCVLLLENVIMID